MPHIPKVITGKGDVTCEFIGIARNRREKSLGGLPHIHFNGAGGNITSGKYNDGTEAVAADFGKKGRNSHAAGMGANQKDCYYKKCCMENCAL